ncbi:MAG: PEP-CTERM sorting domain-containing protein [Sandarakinorhabdus sp.]|nr:PEP-CTERM sorting domain-containing protein [Sandarakinorhabdus sp.]
MGTTSNDNIGPILDNVLVTQVPEPATWAMLIAGFGLVGFAMRRRRTLSAA